MDVVATQQPPPAARIGVTKPPRAHLPCASGLAVLYLLFFSYHLFASLSGLEIAHVTLAQGAKVGDANVVTEMYNFLVANDSTIFSGSVSALRIDGSGGFFPSTALTYGLQRPIAPAVPGTTSHSAPNVTSSTSTSRMNNLAEAFVAISFAQIASRGLLPFARTAAIPFQYLPPPFNVQTTPFVNPTYPSTPMTLEMLLYHTSTLTEFGFDTLGAAATPGPAKTLQQFVHDFFQQPAASIWTSGNLPGTAASYTYSRTNIAVATYVLGKVLELDTAITAGTLHTPMQYIQAYIIAPLGMTSTFLLSPSGSIPPLENPDPAVNPAEMAALQQSTIQEVAADGATVVTVKPLHAVYTAQFMYYSTPADVTRLMFSIFLSGNNNEVANYLTTQPMSLAAKSSTDSPSYYANRTFGFFLINARNMCSTIVKTGVISFCSFSTTGASSIVGLIANGINNQMGFMCSPTTCSASALSYHASSTGSPTQSPTLTLLMSGITLYTVGGDSPPAVPYPPEGGDLYGLYVFLGVFCTIIVTIVMSYVADFIIQPTPLNRKVPRQPTRPYTTNAPPSNTALGAGGGHSVPEASNTAAAFYADGRGDDRAGYHEEYNHPDPRAQRFSNGAYPDEEGGAAYRAGSRGVGYGHREEMGMRTPDGYENNGDRMHSEGYNIGGGISPPPLRRIDAYDD